MAGAAPEERESVGRLLLLHAVGVDASFFDAIAVLIAVVTLTQLPVGPSVGAAAAVLILGSGGEAAAAAAGMLMTVTGTVGGLCLAGWAAADQLWSVSRGSALRRGRSRAPRYAMPRACRPRSGRSPKRWCDPGVSAIVRLSALRAVT